MGRKSKLVQVNKKHKDSSKLQKSIQKKIVLSTSAKKQLINESKAARNQRKYQRKENSVKLNKDSECNQRGNNNSAPLLCGIFPLFEFTEAEVMLALLRNTDKDAKLEKIDSLPNMEKLQSECFIFKSKKFRKSFVFATCTDFHDRFDYLDLCKVVDWAIFVLPNDLETLIGDYPADLISSLIAQGLPSSCFVSLMSRNEFKLKNYEREFETITKLSLGDRRIQSLTNEADANKLMRHLAENCKPNYSATKKSDISSKSIHRKRGYFLTQNITVNRESDEESVILTGCMRGAGMNLLLTKTVHLTDIGDFQIKEVKWISPEESNRFNRNNNSLQWRSKAIDHIQLSIDDEMSNENIEENDKEIDASSESENEESVSMDDDVDYDSEGEFIGDIPSDKSDDDEYDEKDDDKMSFATSAQTGYSETQLLKFRESREAAKNPDEIELNPHEKAREKLRKYRGINGFKAAIWPVNEDLPECYSKIYHFRNYVHDRNRLLNIIRSNADNNNNDQSDVFIRPGSSFEMILKPFSIGACDNLTSLLLKRPYRHLIGSGLFQFEERVSVLHLNLRRLTVVDESAMEELSKLAPNPDQSTVAFGEESLSHLASVNPDSYPVSPVSEPIESKQTMLFQIGFRRFSSTPIYSDFSANSDQIGSRGKSRFCQFMEPNKSVVASIYGPVSYGPLPVLQFRIRQSEFDDSRLSPPFVGELVATGGLLAIDPTRPIIKRVLLPGQVYKVNKRSVLVRYMFHNVEDIDHFMGVRLHSKSGIKGNILGSKGTHGTMKCHFEKTLSQKEDVFMPLYKRVFPRFTVDNMYQFLSDSVFLDDNDNCAEKVNSAMDTLF